MPYATMGVRRDSRAGLSPRPGDSSEGCKRRPAGSPRSGGHSCPPRQWQPWHTGRNFVWPHPPPPALTRTRQERLSPYYLYDSIRQASFSDRRSPPPHSPSPVGFADIRGVRPHTGSPQADSEGADIPLGPLPLHRPVRRGRAVRDPWGSQVTSTPCPRGGRETEVRPQKPTNKAATGKPNWLPEASKGSSRSSIKLPPENAIQSPLSNRYALALNSLSFCPRTKLQKPANIL